MKGAERFYSGDEAWRMNVEAARPLWHGTELQNALPARLDGDLEIAMVMYLRSGDHSLEWLDMRVPALNGKTPASCMSTSRSA